MPQATPPGCHDGAASAAAPGMAAVLRAEGTVLLCAPSPGRQVGAVFPAASWAGTCCHAGLCVISSERLMSHGSCGVIICLHLSVTGVSNGSVTVAPRRPRAGAGRRAGRCASRAPRGRHAAPLLPPALSRCPSLFPALCLPLFLSCPEGLALSLAGWKRCQRMFLCAACQVPGERAWKRSAGGAVGARENHCFSLLACCIF